MKHDYELIQIFREEAQDLLDTINDYLKKWLVSPLDKELLFPILREIHTLKGSARMVSLVGLNEYIQALEVILKGIYEDTISPVSSLLQEIQYGFDYLNFYIDSYHDFKFPDDSKIPIAALKKHIKEEEQATTEKPTDYYPPMTGKAESINYIRIESEKLEKFSFLASQINIARSHIEQHLKRAFEGLNEAVKQVKLVQEQAKYLQIKADANISNYASYRESGGGNEDFDILELDRYSVFQQATRELSEKINMVENTTDRVVNFIRNAELNLVEQKRTARLLEEGITHSRLISMDKLIPRLERVVRQVAHELEKEVRLECIKVGGEIDRETLERLIPAFEHMVRNAIDHGIETPEERKEKNKPAYGIITLSLFRQMNEIVIQVADDGRGVDVDKIRKKAIEKNLWNKDVPISQADAFQLIFMPGFSTKDEVTPISGQGVGLDVVNAEVNRLGGVLKIDSVPGIGTEFTIRLPFTLSLNQALIFSLHEQFYALPLAQLLGLKRYSIAQITKAMQGPEFLEFDGNNYTLHYLGELLENEKWQYDERIQKEFPVLFLKSDDNYIAILVDRLIGSWEIVIKPIGSQLQLIREISGVSLFSEEKIVFILDAPTLIESACRIKVPQPGHLVHHKQPIILIVDDSITVRQVTSRFLKRHQYDPVGARDGKEALSYLAQNIPEVVLLDLEMPEMDGFEVLERMREDPRLCNIPVIVITSRAGEKHQRRAKRLGVHAYLTKPFLEEHLLALLRKIIDE